MLSVDDARAMPAIRKVYFFPVILFECIMKRTPAIAAVACERFLPCIVKINVYFIGLEEHVFIERQVGILFGSLAFLYPTGLVCLILIFSQWNIPYRCNVY
jgi:hypothetical protein